MEISKEWFLSFPPAIILILMGIFARIQQGSWFAPGAFFALVWSILVWVPLLLAPDFYVWPVAVWWIVNFVCALYLGSIFGMALGLKKDTTSIADSGKITNLTVIKVLILLGSICGFGSVLILLFSTGKGINTFFSIKAMAQAGREFSIARYLEGYTEPFLARLLMTGTYFAALLGGMIFAIKSKINYRWLAFTPFLPSLAIAIILTTRSAFLYTLVLWLGAYFATGITVNKGRFRLFTLPLMLWCGGTIVIIILMFILLQMSRYGLNDFKGMFFVVERLRIWFFSYLAGFSIWLQQSGLSQDNLGLGAFSVAGVFNAFGAAVRELGLYKENVFICAKKDYFTNIFTIFRGLIQDFGAIGSLFFLFTFGFVAGLAFSRSQRGHQFFIPILSIFYVATLWSNIVSIFNYNSILLALILFALYPFCVRLLSSLSSCTHLIKQEGCTSGQRNT